MRGVVVIVMVMVSVFMTIMAVGIMRCKRLRRDGQRRMSGVAMHAVRVGVVVFGRWFHGSIIASPRFSFRSAGSGSVSVVTDRRVIWKHAKTLYKPRQCLIYANCPCHRHKRHLHLHEANNSRRPASRTGAKLCRWISQGPTDINAAR